MRKSIVSRSFCILAVIIILTSCATYGPVPGKFTGSVVGVTDGDTIRVLYNRQEVRVRLFGVDCPEKNQAFGSAAKKFTSDMVFRKTVTVVVKDTDRYGRSVGVVTLQNGKQLNKALVAAGMAWWYRQYDPDDAELERLESQARTRKIGLWSEKYPTPPWDFRAEERKYRQR